MNTNEVLQGDKWLGHPLHPALVAVPIGSWIFSLLMDGLSAVTGNECAQEAADKAITVGIGGAGLSAAAGVAEFGRTSPNSEARDYAITHGALNASITALYGLNAAIRSARRARGKPAGFIPKLMSLAGVAALGYTGWLGGKMVFENGVGVQIDKVAGQENPPEQAKVREERRERTKAKASI